jgi:hypothetical protein
MAAKEDKINKINKQVGKELKRRGIPLTLTQTQEKLYSFKFKSISNPTSPLINSQLFGVSDEGEAHDSFLINDKNLYINNAEIIINDFSMPPFECPDLDLIKYK